MLKIKLLSTTQLFYLTMSLLSLFTRRKVFENLATRKKKKAAAPDFFLFI